MELDLLLGSWSLADSASRKPEAAIHQLIPQSPGGHYRPSHKKRIGKWVRAASLGLRYWSGSSVDKYTFQTTSTARSPISILRSPPLWSGWSEDHTGLMRKCRPISEKTKHLGRSDGQGWHWRSATRNRGNLSIGNLQVQRAHRVCLSLFYSGTYGFGTDGNPNSAAVFEGAGGGDLRSCTR